MKLIDFHNHILPNIDDGPKSIDVICSMLKTAEKQGIEEIVTTTHYLHPMMDGKHDDIAHLIDEKLTIVNNLIKDNNLNIKVYPGMEVFFMPDMLNYLDNKYITIGDGRYMLIEFPVNTIPVSYKQVFYELQKQNITPIIAHPERYKIVQSNYDILYDWLDQGCLLQVDAGSILNKMGKKAYIASQYIIKNNLCQLVGSDAHNNVNRNFMLFEAYNACYKIVGEEAYKWVYYNPKKIIIGEEIEVIYNNREESKSIFNKIYDFLKF